MQSAPAKIIFYTSHVAAVAQSVGFLLSSNKIPHEVKTLNLKKGEQNDADFKKLSPLGKVPAIVDGDFSLFESNTIMRYLCNSQPVAEHWYPKDPKKQALVNLYFDWHGANFANFEKQLYVQLNSLWQEKHPTEVEEAKVASEKARKDMEEVFLSRRKFLASDDQITVADLAVVWQILWAKALEIQLSERLDEYYAAVKEYPGMAEKLEEYRLALTGMMGRMGAAKNQPKEGEKEGAKEGEKEGSK